MYPTQERVKRVEIQGGRDVLIIRFYASFHIEVNLVLLLLGLKVMGKRFLNLSSPSFCMPYVSKVL